MKGFVSIARIFTGDGRVTANALRKDVETTCIELL